MKSNKFYSLSKMLILTDAVAMTALFFAAWKLYYRDAAVANFYVKGELMLCGIFMLLYVIFGHVYGAFNTSSESVADKVYSQGLSMLFSDIIMYLVFVLLAKRFINVLPMLAALFAQFAFAWGWALAAKKVFLKYAPMKKSVVIYDDRLDFERALRREGRHLKYNILKAYSIDEYRLDPSVIDGFDVVFLSGVHSRERNIVLKQCFKQGKQIYVMPRIGDILMSSAKPVQMFSLPVLHIDSYDPSPFFLAVKRAFDIVFAILGIIVLSPLMLVTAIAVKATDGGPVIYKQTRVTTNGKLFKVWKFRSMRVDAEKDGVARLSTGDNDDRITPVGRIIRKVRIDELPQLFNILKGDMSVVGPRPERPEIIEQYYKFLPEFNLRLRAKCGLTGYAQVFGKYNSTPYDKLEMDLMYIAKPGIVEDLKIILATIKILFIPDSTEGIQEGQITAAAIIEADIETGDKK